MGFGAAERLAGGQANIYGVRSSLRALADAGAEFELGRSRLELPLEALSVVAPINRR